jgi:thioredoxin 1
MSYDDELEKIKMRKLKEILSGQSQRPIVVAEPVEVTDLNFKQFINSNKYSVVDFWAEWCAPCRAIAPIVKELAEQYAGKVVFGKLNVDENPRTASEYGIMGIPTLILFKDGRPVDMVVGAVPRRVLEGRIVKLLQS